MRLIYPSVSSTEYIDMSRKDSIPQKSSRFSLFLFLNLFIGMYVLSFVLIFVVLIVLRRMLTFLTGPVFLLSAVLALVSSAVLFMVFRPHKQEKPQRSTFNQDMFDYLKMCEDLRVNTVYDVSLHIVGESCFIELEYDRNNRKEKKKIDMSWHVSPGINDVVIDFDRREVSVPEKMCDSLEEK